MLVPIVTTICVFSFVAVAVWSKNRRREREAFYRGEALKKIAEMQGAGSSSAIEFMREEEKRAWRGKVESQKLGGLIMIAAGVALMVFLRMMPDTAREQVYYVGLIPLLIGLVLVVYAHFLAPKE
jgi:ferric-dicitrate binding protein FerR (iron transport regulator)